MSNQKLELNNNTKSDNSKLYSYYILRRPQKYDEIFKTVFDTIK